MNIDINMDEWDELEGPDELQDLASGFSSGPADVDDEDAGLDLDEVTKAHVPSDLRSEMLHMAVRPDDPSELGYPPTLPVEVALQTAPEDDIREAYGFTRTQWNLLKHNDQFKSDVTAARAMLSEEGMSFKAKARLQAEELLKTSWSLIHDRSGDVPPSVKADLLKFTIKAAGLEASPKDSMQAITPLQINISL